MKTKLNTAEEWAGMYMPADFFGATRRKEIFEQAMLNAAKWGMEQAADMAEAVGWRNERLVKRIRDAANKLELPK